MAGRRTKPTLALAVALVACCGGATSACSFILGIDDQGELFDVAPDAASDGSSDGLVQREASTGDARSDASAPEAAAPDAAEAAVDCAGPIKRVFLSSVATPGAISDMGATGADALCQKLANAAKLGGTWRAWISDDKSSPAMRFTKHTGPYVLVDGATVVACSWSGLTTSSVLLHPIDRTEDGGAPAGSPCNGTGVLVWTDTLADGTEDPAGASCTQWSDGANDVTGACGCTDLTAPGGWSLATGLDQTCDTSLPVYCFEQ